MNSTRRKENFYFGPCDLISTLSDLLEQSSQAGLLKSLSIGAAADRSRPISARVPWRLPALLLLDQVSWSEAGSIGASAGNLVPRSARVGFAVHHFILQLIRYHLFTWDLWLAPIRTYAGGGQAAIPTRASSSSDRPQTRPTLAFLCLISRSEGGPIRTSAG